MRVKDRSKRKNLISRVLRNRDIRLVDLDVDHMGHLWAAYRMGVWGHVIEDGLTQEEFTNLIVNISEGNRIMIIENGKPLGFVSVKEDERTIEPRIDWFPWASNRNKIEGVVRVILDLRKIKTLMIWAEWGENPFFTYIAKYGIMRRVGTFNADQKYAVFQSMKNKEA